MTFSISKALAKINELQKFVEKTWPDDDAEETVSKTHHLVDDKLKKLTDECPEDPSLDEQIFTILSSRGNDMKNHFILPAFWGKELPPNTEDYAPQLLEKYKSAFDLFKAAKPDPLAQRNVLVDISILCCKFDNNFYNNGYN